MVDENITKIGQLLDAMAETTEQLKKALEAKNSVEVEKAKKHILALQAQIKELIK